MGKLPEKTTFDMKEKEETSGRETTVSVPELSVAWLDGTYIFILLTKWLLEFSST